MTEETVSTHDPIQRRPDVALQPSPLSYEWVYQNGYHVPGISVHAGWELYAAPSRYVSNCMELFYLNHERAAVCPYFGYALHELCDPNTSEFAVYRDAK